MSGVGPGSSFDEQASRYDARTGLPPGVGAAVARAIVDAAMVRADGVLVELGAGTGEIGVHLARLPLRYVGIDVSAAMLRVFRDKLGGAMPASLLLADANRDWPLVDHAASVVFASRAMHLLAAEHVVRQSFRVCHRGGSLMMGRVVRDPHGVRERLRRQRLELLRRAGITPVHDRVGTRRLIARCLAAGATVAVRQVVAEWSGETTPAAVIAEWESIDRAGAVEVDPALRQRLHEALRQWAGVELGGLDRGEPYREQYAIDHVRLP